MEYPETAEDNIKTGVARWEENSIQPPVTDTRARRLRAVAEVCGTLVA